MNSHKTPPPFLTPADGGLIIRLKVTPGARQDAIKGILGDSLKVMVRAAPTDGKANESIIQLIAGVLQIPARTVQILSGAHSRQKRVLVSGITLEAAAKLLTNHTTA